jgi:hypothetical protein
MASVVESIDVSVPLSTAYNQWTQFDLDRRVTGDLERFKAYIEGRGSETGTWRGEVEVPSGR